MAARYYNISAAEMQTFMQARGFRLMTVPGTIELVYGKIVKIGEHRLSLRVNTGINPSGQSRAVGTDAIRVQLFYMYDGEPCPVGKSQKCLRVSSWQANLGSAIGNHADPTNFTVCPACGHPSVIRKTRDKKRKFWGCVTYFKTHCNGKAA